MTQYAPILRQNMSCSMPVEFAYYSCRKFLDVCAHCGDKDCSVEELKNAFKTFLPICQGCKGTKEPVTRGKYKHPTSSNSKASPGGNYAGTSIAALSIIDIGSVIFGSTDNLVSYLQHRQLLADSQTCGYCAIPMVLGKKGQIFLMAWSFDVVPARQPSH